jgi:hypothetical protein
MDIFAGKGGDPPSLPASRAIKAATFIEKTGKTA